MKPAAALLLVAIAPLLLQTSCRTTRERAPVDPADAAPVHSSAVRAWRVVEAGAVRGWVISYREDARDPREFFAVQNELRQELGLIDAQGRAWRYRPFQAEPEHLTSSTLADGARAILGASADAKLEEVSLADFGRPR
ncbi:MAG: hypothetical protein EPO68_00170 [Planctomycetota bacterium]|nr:MAG: hypothetical protein EPO68_00170 [Planctomycetota bacterium]